MALLALSLAIGFADSSQERLAKFRAEFEREADPVRKARRVPRLGDALFVLLRERVDEANYEAALAALTEYRDAVRIAFDALAASGRNAERQSGGFRHLQIHVRQSVRDLSESIVAVAFDQRPPFEAIRKELEEFDKKLLDMLFPRQPEKKPAPAKEKPR